MHTRERKTDRENAKGHKREGTSYLIIYFSLRGTDREIKRKSAREIERKREREKERE